jgi:hypothetical protein
MRVRAKCWQIMLPVALSIWATGCTGLHTGATHKSSDEDNEVTFLIQKGTADSLATASLLAHLTQSDADEDTADAASARPEPSVLIGKAVALAPDRPELIWLQYRDCEQRRCTELMQIATRLKALDPDNGFAWLADLRTVQSLATPEVTKLLSQIGATRYPRLYWNMLTVMMFDALTHGDRSRPATAITRDADDRLTHVTGILAAVDIPAFQAITRACRLDQFDLPGRRAACESLMARLETSDAVITQNLSLSLQQSWWPVDSPQRSALHGRLLQQRYLSVASNRVRGPHADSDARMRVDLMRHLPREEDVERAMLLAFKEPLDRPADWHSPGEE